MFGVACHNMSVCSAFSVFCVVRAQLIVLNSSSIPPLLFDLAWASGENFENKPIHALIFCSLMLAMTQLCGLEARIEGMTVALQAIDHDQTCKSLCCMLVRQSVVMLKLLE